MNTKKNNEIHYTVTEEVHNAIAAFLERLDQNTIKQVLSSPRNGIQFSEPEIEIMSFFLLQFYTEVVNSNNQ